MINIFRMITDRLLPKRRQPSVDPMYEFVIKSHRDFFCDVQALLKSEHGLYCDEVFQSIEKYLQKEFGLIYSRNTVIPNPFNCCLEFHNATHDMNLDRFAQAVIFSWGFMSIWVYHTNGLKTYYLPGGREEGYEIDPSKCVMLNYD